MHGNADILQMTFSRMLSHSTRSSNSFRNSNGFKQDKFEQKVVEIAQKRYPQLLDVP